jgi:hypothetical protein
MELSAAREMAAEVVRTLKTHRETIEIAICASARAACGFRQLQ